MRICPNFVPPAGVNPAPGRMAGGGSVFTEAGAHVPHGFELHCNLKRRPNNLEINWGAGNNFHLDSLTAAVCFTDSAKIVVKASGQTVLSVSGTIDHGNYQAHAH